MRRHVTGSPTRPHPRRTNETSSSTDDILDLLRTLEPLVELEPPASEGDIESVERGLGLSLPDELRGFLRASDGAAAGIELNSGRSSGTRPTSSGRSRRSTAIASHSRWCPRRDTSTSSRTRAWTTLFGCPIHSPSQVGPDVVWWDPLEDVLSPAGASFQSWLHDWLTDTLRLERLGLGPRKPTGQGSNPVRSARPGASRRGRPRARPRARSSRRTATSP